MLKNIFDLKGFKEQAEKVKNELKEERIIVDSGGGMVEVEVDGLGNIIGLKIEESLLGEKDKDLIEDLIVAAINKSREKVKELWQKKMEEYLGILPLSGFGDIIA